MADQQADRIRLDTWLKIARIAKTRTLAARLCDGGKVKVNGASAKAARLVTVGDRLQVHHRGQTRALVVEDICHHSIAAKEARLLYTEAAPSPAEVLRREVEAEMRKAAAAHPPTFKGRPTKRDRRRLETWRRGGA